MTVAAQHDLGLGPVGPDRPHEAAQEGADFLAAWASGGTQHSRDEAALAVEHDDRLEAIFVVSPIEQPQLLSAMNGVERVVDVEHNALGNVAEGRAIEIDHG